MSSGWRGCLGLDCRELVRTRQNEMQMWLEAVEDVLSSLGEPRRLRQKQVGAWLPGARPALGAREMDREEERAFISKPQLNLYASSSAHRHLPLLLPAHLAPDAAQRSSLPPAPPPVLWGPDAPKPKGHSHQKTHTVPKGQAGARCGQG